MKVMGVVPSSSDLRLAVVEGMCSAPRLVPTHQKTVRLPAGTNDAQRLQSLYRLLSTLFREQRVEKICVLQGGNSQYGGPSAERVKAEGIIQLVGADLSIHTELIAPQTLRAKEKKFADLTKGTPESVLNNSEPFVPKPWRDAVLLAWMGLEA